MEVTVAVVAPGFAVGVTAMAALGAAVTGGPPEEDRAVPVPREAGAVGTFAGLTPGDPAPPDVVPIERVAPVALPGGAIPAPVAVWLVTGVGAVPVTGVPVAAGACPEPRVPAAGLAPGVAPAPAAPGAFPARSMNRSITSSIPPEASWVTAPAMSPQ
jgi:hypothetical protein